MGIHLTTRHAACSAVGGENPELSLAKLWHGWIGRWKQVDREPENPYSLATLINRSGLYRHLLLRLQRRLRETNFWRAHLIGGTRVHCRTVLYPRGVPVRFTAVVRTEIAKHVFRQFVDTEDFTRDLCIDSDDLSYVALSLERRLSVRLDSCEYRKVNNVVELARVLHAALSMKGSG